MLKKHSLFKNSFQSTKGATTAAEQKYNLEIKTKTEVSNTQQLNAQGSTDLSYKLCIVTGC